MIFKEFKDIVLQERQLMPDLTEYLYGQVFVRKPIGFVDLEKVSKRKMPYEAREWIKSLKMITFKDVYGYDPKEAKGEEFYGGPDNGQFRMPTPQYFIVKAGGKKILIDTQGYNYARYAAQLMA
jgi:hypothetical protein